VSLLWDQACQEAYEDIKRYLTKPSVLVASTLGKPFLLYVKAMDHSLSALLAQKDNNGREEAIYYLSRTLIREESRYNPIEKECLALVFAIQKTRHYLVSQTIHVISRYDTLFVPQKAVKGQTLAEFLLLIWFRKAQNFMKTFWMKSSNLI